MIDIVISMLMLVGSFFFMVAAIGLLNLPDVYMRASATAKAITLGMGCLLLAMTLHFMDIATSALAFLVMLFFALTAPVAAHMVGRAAYLAGSPLWKGTVHDDLANYYDPSSYRHGAKDFMTHLLRTKAVMPPTRISPAGSKQTSDMEMEAELIEIIVPYNADVAGKPISELNLPQDCLITVVGRNERFTVASGKNVLEEGDVILVLANKENRKTLQAIFNKIKIPPKKDGESTI